MLHRDGIDSDKYSVLEVLPLPTATEELVWVTNIFIAADLTERRQSLANYPAISITYTFVLTPNNRDFIADLVSRAHNEWVLVYLPHMTRGRVLANGQVAVVSAGGNSYPYHQYCCVFTSTDIYYLPITTNAGNSSDIVLVDPLPLSSFFVGQTVFVAPCFIAQISSKFNYSDVGPFRYGGRLKLTFRMSGESEEAMTYHVDDFDFIQAVQSPLNIGVARRQSNFAARPSPAHVYTPHAYRQGQTPIVSATYWLNYDAYTRQDYNFRGAMMKRLGSLTADNYIDTTSLHRLSDDKIVINYDLGVAKASTSMRKVNA